jgi:hypothetical protein
LDPVIIIASPDFSEIGAFVGFLIFKALLVIIGVCLLLALWRRWAVFSGIVFASCLLLGLSLKPWLMLDLPVSLDSVDSEINAMFSETVFIWAVAFAISGVLFWMTILRRKRFLELKPAGTEN